MKLTTTSKSLESLPKAYTRIILEEKGVERFVEKEGTAELHICTGKFKEVEPRNFRTIIRTIVQTAKKYKLEKVAVQFQNPPFPKLNRYDETWILSTIAENLLLADYEFTKYKGKPERSTLKEVLICGGMSKDAATGMKHGEILATYMNACRDIANMPGGDMTPALLGEAAKRVLKGTKTKVTILDEKEIGKLGMGALMGVGKGAKDKPRFIIVEYWGLGKPKGSARKQKQQNVDKHDPTADDGDLNAGLGDVTIDEHDPIVHEGDLNAEQGDITTDKHNPIVFVGKGITFDTGGLQIKPGMSMYEMHMDMSGGAAVIAAIGAIAKLGIKKNVIGLIPAAENAVSDESIRPGDVLRSMSGKTIDVLHTDAEGRLVLADALHYARKYEPRLLIDVATLTGAALVALGQHAHVIMTKDRKLEDRLRELGEECGDYTFPLPLWDEYKQYTKGVHGDISNIPSGDTKYGGTINGGMFLSHFTEGIKWAHIDMAPRMTSVPSDKLAKGATGEPTRLLVNIAEKL